MSHKKSIKSAVPGMNTQINSIINTQNSHPLPELRISVNFVNINETIACRNPAKTTINQNIVNSTNNDNLSLTLESSKNSGSQNSTRRMGKTVYQAIRLEGFAPDSEFLDEKTQICTLVCPGPPDTYLYPNLDTIENEASTVVDWIHRMGFPALYSYKYEHVSRTAASFARFTTVYTQDLSSKIRGIEYFFVWLFAMDDIVFDSIYAKKSSSEQQQSAQKAFTIIVNILAGKTGLEEVDFSVALIPCFEQFCKAIQSIDESLRQDFPNYENSKGHFVTSVKKYLNCSHWKYQRNDWKTCPESSYIFFRSHCGALYCTFELNALAKNINLSDEFRASIEFKRYFDAMATSMSVANDILSLRKEMQDSQSENLIIHKMNNKKLSLGQALKETISFTNAETNEARIYAAQLTQKYSNNENAHKFIESMNFCFEGHLRWYGYCKRYGMIKVSAQTLTEDGYSRIFHNNSYCRRNSTLF